MCSLNTYSCSFLIQIADSNIGADHHIHRDAPATLKQNAENLGHVSIPVPVAVVFLLKVWLICFQHKHNFHILLQILHHSCPFNAQTWQTAPEANQPFS